MKPGQLFRSVVYSTWFLAGVPALIIMLFINPQLSRFRLTAVPTGSTPGQTVYSDLNGDSITELISENKGLPYYHLLVRDNDNKVYDQWNLKDDFNFHMAPYFTGDYDHNGYSELYVFTHKNDSLFLNINEFFRKGGLRRERIFICIIGFIKGEVTSNVFKAGFYDRNKDGNDELYCSLSTGFGIVPRRLFLYDIAADRLQVTPEKGVASLFPEMSDYDNDSRPEIYGTVSGSGNQDKLIGYSDWSSWLMVYNDSLNFKFKPVEFPGYPSLLQVQPFHKGKETYLALARISGSADTSVQPSFLYLYTADGRFVRSRRLSEITTAGFLYLFVGKSRGHEKLFLLTDKLFELDEKLNVIRTIEVPLHSDYWLYKFDIDNDLAPELLLYSQDESTVLVYDNDLRKLGELSLKTPDEFWQLSLETRKMNTSRLFLWSGGSSWFIDIKKNRFYYLGFMEYPGIFLAFFLLIFSVKKITAYQITQKESLKQRLVTLQLQGIKAQLDPHFTFNTLNTVASLIYQNEREEAYDFMNKFTKLLRGMISDAERIYRTLGEEIEFVKTYLDLEQQRHGGKFRYTIDLDEGVTQQENVPKLVLQTFAENCVKHGISGYDSGGLISIKVTRDKNYLKLTIEDNGIGRIRSAGKSRSTGRGLKLATEFYDILNQVNKNHINYKISDLYDQNGKSSGTRVEVWVPLEKNVV